MGNPFKTKMNVSNKNIHFRFNLRVNVSIIQSDAEQGFVDLADFHIYSSFSHDFRGAIRFFTKMQVGESMLISSFYISHTRENS